jgi:hypothetical protein
MRDTRRQRETTAVFVVAGIAAVLTHYLSPNLKRKLKVKR